MRPQDHDNGVNAERLITAQVTLGVACGTAFEVSFSFECPVEVRPDQIFEAANRVDTLEVDIDDRVTTDWQRALCRAIDEHHAPSMSVGDAFTIILPHGQGIVRHICDRSSWTTTVTATL